MGQEQASSGNLVVTFAINRILQRALLCQSEAEVADFCLQVAEDLTGSPIGFIGERSESGSLDLLAVRESSPAQYQSPKAREPRTFPDIRVRGLLGRVLFDKRPLMTNDVASHPEGLGFPDGHPVVTRFLGIPFEETGEVDGLLALANKPDDYTSEDLERLEALTVCFGTVLAHYRARRALHQLTEELESRVAERTRDLEEFAYSVSHDLRAPLRAIGGFSQILARRHREDLNEEGRRYVDHVVQASQQMDQLIQSLLRYSRLGRNSVDLKPVALSKVLEVVSRTMGERVADSGGRLTITDGLPVVLGDSSLIQQLFTNLIDNGFTYQASKTVPDVVVDCRPAEDGVVVCVSDNGIGIAAEYREKVFSAFQRLHSDSEYPGTGIGLAIVRKAAALMEGEVWVESSPQGGCTFCVRLPVAKESKAKDSEQHEQERADTSSRR